MESRTERRRGFDVAVRVSLLESDLDDVVAAVAGLRRAMNTNTAALLAVFVALVGALATLAFR